jgi:PKD repeat protein
MKAVYILFISFVISATAFAQHETDKWYFGIFAGLDFTPSVPAPILTGNLYTTEGSASISDTAGNLLFYTDGITIYNANNTAMPNGSGLLGDVSTTQSALIVKKPGSNTLFYVFTLAADGGADGLRYSIVDMSLQSGLGDVTAVKNVFIADHLTEKLCAVKGSNNSDVWIMVHGFGDNKFYAYKLTTAGLMTTPVISQAGSIHDSTAIQNSYGYMKFSPDGNKLALAMGYLNKAELFNFSTLDGGVTAPVTFTYPDHCYGIEFSGNSKFLYLTHYNVTAQTYTLEQYNTHAGNAAAIISSKYTVYISADPDEMRALQLARNGKIYIAKANSGLMDVLNNPDAAGLNCGYSPSAVSLGGNTCMLGLPNFVASYFRELLPPEASFGASDSTVCANSCISFGDSSGYATSWLWSFPGGSPSTSIQKNPGPICYGATGSYNVTLIVSNSKGSDTLTIPNFITVLPQPAVPTITVTGDTLASSAAASYQWFLNNNPIPGATGQTYVAIASGNYKVMVTGVNGCTASSATTNIVVSGITGLSINNLDIFPQPVKNELFISCKGLEQIREARLADVAGRVHPLLFNKSGNYWVADMAEIPAGFYLLRLTGKSGVVYSARLMKGN